MDLDVREAIWNGNIAIQVSIDPSEFSHMLTSSDLYTVKLSSFYVPIIYAKWNNNNCAGDGKEV